MYYLVDKFSDDEKEIIKEVELTDFWNNNLYFFKKYSSFLNCLKEKHYTIKHISDSLKFKKYKLNNYLFYKYRVVIVNEYFKNLWVYDGKTFKKFDIYIIPEICGNCKILLENKYRYKDNKYYCLDCYEKI